MIKRYMMIQDKVNEDGVSGGYSIEEKTPPAESKEPAKSEADGSVVDDYGYKTEKVQDSDAKKDDVGEKKEDKKTSEEKVEEVKDPATGYDLDENKAPAEEKKAEPEVKEEKKDDLGFELDVKDLEAKVADGIKAFIKENKITKEVAQAFVEFKKSEIAAQKQSQIETEKIEKAAIEQVKRDWQKELRSDPTFGGENFAKNIMNVEKVLNDFMPGTKKLLTERKTMLPPYVMRDLSNLAKQLYSTEKLVSGDASINSKPEEKETSHLDFYT